MSTTPDPILEAFEAAKRSFRDSLTDPSLFDDILRTTTADQVYDATEKLQAKLGSEGRLRHLGKIRPFLERVTAYASVVDTFVQVKPDILALIWGPIRLLLQWSSNLTQCWDAFTNAIVRIGEALPEFVDVVRTFSSKEAIKELLALFYRDVLDFYVLLLKFVNMSHPKLLFESLWPKHKAKVDVVVHNIERHALLMRNKFTLEHIKEEHEARVKALAHSEQTNNFQELQRFQALMNRVSPALYDKRMDWLRNRSCEGSPRWLMQEKCFSDWLDASNRSIPILWVQGIPGSGKTFLAAAIVDQAKSRGQALFVFASHMYQTSTTALSVLQSLMFQLVFDNTDLQTVLVEGNERELTSNTAYAANMLKTLLKCSGPTYIVIDGLDEMEEMECRILLNHLVGLPGECKDARIVISSRAEDNISTMLEKKKAKAIRLDSKNSGSIQVYVDRRVKDLLDNGKFDSESRSEIESSLVPIAANARGMFLYARIVMDNLDLLIDPDEIRNELRVLPLDLNAAYHRILLRINQLPLPQRLKARRIIGWIGCAPMPMTNQEIEQALLVDSNSATATPTVLGRLNFVRICGPIVEIVDERLQFVHFTVQDHQISDYIDKAEANLSLATSCLAYLCSGVFDTELSDDEIQDHVLSGQYRLHGFVAQNWISLVKPYINQPGTMREHSHLVELLTRLALELNNYQYRAVTDYTKSAFKAIEEEWPEICHVLHGTVQFLCDETKFTWNYKNKGFARRILTPDRLVGTSWVNFDPLILSQMSVRIFENVEVLAHKPQVSDRTGESQHCSVLEKHYGPRFYKCIYPSCQFSREGFMSTQDRKVHLKNHSRPWKCSVASCPFADLGFTSSRALNDHWFKHHKEEVPPQQNVVDLDGIHTDELLTLIYETVRTSDIARLQALLLHPSLGNYSLHDVLTVAARVGSAPMVDLIHTQIGARFDHQNKYKPSFVKAVVQSEAVDLFGWLLDRLDEILESEGSRVHSYTIFVTAVLKTDCQEIYDLFEAHIFSGRPQNAPPLSRWDSEPLSNAMFTRRRTAILFEQVAFNAVKKSPDKEVRLIHTWTKIATCSDLQPNVFGHALTCLARSSCSVVMGQALMRLGADVNFPHTESSRGKGKTALHFAAAQESAEAAQFMRFLLEQGADTRITWSGRSVDTLPGPVHIFKHLGMSWKELVCITQPGNRTSRIEIHLLD
ncbi:hypothetical protein BX600DRAFT_538673 [Xylariales sp. PMI_506]|nr:hypothetical protein BX600DRAFT_538673 [Xylariales sp. PMI_506]